MSEDFKHHNDQVGKLGSRISGHMLLHAVIETFRWVSTVIVAFVIGQHLQGAGVVPLLLIVSMVVGILVTTYVSFMIADTLQRLRRQQDEHRVLRDGARTS